MISRRSFSIENNQGFTLVELMITLAMSGIIVAAIYSAYIIQQKTYYTQGQVVEMQQNIRAALEMMSSEIRMAGYDPEGNAATASPPIPLANSTSLQVRMDLNGDGDFLDASEDVTYGLAGVDANNDGVVDNIDIVNNETGVTGSDGKVDANVELTRTLLAGGAQAVAEGIHAVQFYYTLLDGSKVVTPTSSQRKKIAAVQITMLAVSGQRDPKYTDTRTYTTGSGALWGPFNDNFRRRLLVSNVNCRNQGL